MCDDEPVWTRQCERREAARGLSSAREVARYRIVTFRMLDRVSTESDDDQRSFNLTADRDDYPRLRQVQADVEDPEVHDEG